MDLTMGEFEEVGNTVKSFASDNATVVVGTVIDPAMDGEVRVTVVATGIGVDAPKVREERERDKAVREVEREKPREIEREVVPTVQLAKSAPTAEPEAIDYRQFDTPARLRAQPRHEAVDRAGSSRSDYLDIPAFLRRQAD
jgi:cell division protein FtsZ